MSTPKKPQVIAIHGPDRKALLDNDEIIEVIAFFDATGEEIDEDEGDLHQACSCVAGDPEHGWYAINLDQFDGAPIN
jgi:hypothetical protein